MPMRDIPLAPALYEATLQGPVNPTRILIYLPYEDGMFDCALVAEEPTKRRDRQGRVVTEHRVRAVGVCTVRDDGSVQVRLQPQNKPWEQLSAKALAGDTG